MRCDWPKIMRSEVWRCVKLQVGWRRADRNEKEWIDDGNGEVELRRERGERRKDERK